MSEEKNKIKVEIKKLDNSEIEITGEIPAVDFDKHRDIALKNLGNHVNIPGFRKGHVPEKMIENQLGEKAIMEEMSEMAMGQSYQDVIIDNKLEPIGRPEVVITKMALGNPLGFKIKVAVMPEVNLSDYKKVAKEKMKETEKAEVTDKDVEETISELQKMQTVPHEHKEGEGHTTKMGSDSNHILESAGKSEGLSREHDEPDAKLPEINNEFVKKLGDFKDLADFKAKLRENIKFEKERKAKDKKRLEIINEIVKNSKIDLPNIIVEAELDKLVAQMRMDIERSGFKFEDYLKQSGKKEEEIRKEMRTDAEKRAKIQLVLNHIALAEKIEAPKDMMEERTKVMLEQYKDADPERVKIYIETVLINEEVFKFLEGQK